MRTLQTECDFPIGTECLIELSIRSVPSNRKVALRYAPMNGSRHDNLTVRREGHVCCEVHRVVEICGDYAVLSERRIERAVLVVSNDHKILGPIRAGYGPC